MNKEKVNSEQHYALDSQNRLVNIRDIEEGKELYFCPYCKGEMIPKRGKIRDWHFAHKCLTENCSYESYLHSLAKLRLCEWFNNTTNASLYPSPNFPIIPSISVLPEHPNTKDDNGRRAPLLIIVNTDASALYNICFGCPHLSESIAFCNISLIASLIPQLPT